MASLKPHGGVGLNEGTLNIHSAIKKIGCF
jgi:hypothetical protein